MSQDHKKNDYQEEQMVINNYLALNRTVLSVERTFLSYIRTSLTFIVGGISFLQFFGHIINKVIGILLILFGIICFFYGLNKYRKMKKIIKDSQMKLKNIKRLDDVVY